MNEMLWYFGFKLLNDQDLLTLTKSIALFLI